MTLSPYGRRRLPFPYSFRTSLVQDDTLVTDAIDPIPDDCSWFVIQLTNEQRLKFTSGLLAGLDLIYPDEFVDLFQLWLQPSNYPNQFPPQSAGGCMPIDLCQLILDCIETTPELQQAIGRYSLTSGATASDLPVESIEDTDLFLSQPNCDNDKIYGACLQLTQLLNLVSENLLDIFIAGFQQAANLGQLIEAIPLVGELPLDDILTFLEHVATQINVAYQAAYDTQLEEDISCLFFCAAKEDCTLTFEQARDIIRDQMANPITALDFASVVNDMIANNWFGEQSVYVFFYFILETIIVGGEILGQDVNRFATTVATYFNDPNPDWETLCTDCPSEIIVTFDAGGYQDYSFVDGQLDSSFGNPLPSGEWAQIDPDTESVRILIDLVDPKTVRTLKIDAFGSLNRSTIRLVVIDSLDNETVVVNSLETFTGWKTFTYTGTWSDIVTVDARCAVTSPSGTDEQWMDNVTVGFD